VLPDLALMNCQDLAVPATVMQHVVHVESSFNPYAIGVVGAHLLRQPQNLSEAVSTARMLVNRGYNFSLGLAQVNRYNLAKYGLASYSQAFQACPNLQAGARILAHCMARSGNDWGKSFSCYFSGNFITGYQQGYVQKIYASMRSANTVAATGGLAIDVIDNAASHRHTRTTQAAGALPSFIARRIVPLDIPTHTAAQMTILAAQPAPATDPTMGSTSTMTTQVMSPGLGTPVHVSAMGTSPTSSNSGVNPSRTTSQGAPADEAFVF
jgi:type IV secretion system protein VirB1